MKDEKEFRDWLELGGSDAVAWFRSRVTEVLSEAGVFDLLLAVGPLSAGRQKQLENLAITVQTSQVQINELLERQRASQMILDDIVNRQQAAVESEDILDRKLDEPLVSVHDLDLNRAAIEPAPAQSLLEPQMPPHKRRWADDEPLEGSTLTEKILRYIDAHPGAVSNAIYTHLGSDSSTVTSCLRSLFNSGRVTANKTEQPYRYYLAEEVFQPSEPEPAAPVVPEVKLSPSHQIVMKQLLLRPLAIGEIRRRLASRGYIMPKSTVQSALARLTERELLVESANETVGKMWAKKKA